MQLRGRWAALKATFGADQCVEGEEVDGAEMANAESAADGEGESRERSGGSALVSGVERQGREGERERVLRRRRYVTKRGKGERIWKERQRRNMAELVNSMLDEDGVRFRLVSSEEAWENLGRKVSGHTLVGLSETSPRNLRCTVCRQARPKATWYVMCSLLW